MGSKQLQNISSTRVPAVLSHWNNRTAASPKYFCFVFSLLSLPSCGNFPLRTAAVQCVTRLLVLHLGEKNSRKVYLLIKCHFQISVTLKSPDWWIYFFKGVWSVTGRRQCLSLGSMAVRRHHDHDNSYRRKRLGLTYRVRGLVHYQHGGQHGRSAERSSWEFYIQICKQQEESHWAWFKLL